MMNKLDHMMLIWRLGYRLFVTISFFCISEFLLENKKANTELAP